MKISVVVKVKAAREGVLVNEDGSFVVSVSVPPVEGKANERVRELLAKHFGRPKRAVEIVSGMKGKHKIIEIE